MVDLRPYKVKRFSALRHKPDLDLIIQVVKSEGREYVDLRDYIPSRGVVGKGILFDKAILPAVIESLQDLQRHLGTSTGGGQQIEGQGVLDGI